MAARKWSEVKARNLLPARKARLDADIKRELLEMDLRELREAAGMTQVEAAPLAEMTQAEVSKFERREDHLVSSLRRYVRSLGGELEVVAVLGNKRIKLTV